MKKVSVIVPVYNVEKYLRKCLDSLVNQTLKDIEIIVVNDGSPDKSQDIIDEYVKKYPKLVQSYIKKNGGLSDARNYGLKKASGEYISFIDSDDWVDKNMLEEMYSKAVKENADIVICDLTDHYEKYTIKHNCTKFDSPFEVSGSACNKIFKKEAIHGLSFYKSIWYEDLNFTSKLYLNSAKIAVIHKDFYHCHCRDGSIMNNNNSLKNLDIIIAIKDIINYSIEKKCYDKNIISYLIFNHILVTSINRVSKQKSKDKKFVLKELLKYCRENIKDYKKCEFYKKIPKNKKLIASLNYNGLHCISALLLKVKKIIQNK